MKALVTFLSTGCKELIHLTVSIPPLKQPYDQAVFLLLYADCKHRYQRPANRGTINHSSKRGNKKASVSERIGLTDVTVQYHRPAVKGREGKIWGQLVTYGFTDPGFGSSKAAPWRAGANENTVIEFSTDVKVEGKNWLPANMVFILRPAPKSVFSFFLKMAVRGEAIFMMRRKTRCG